MSKKLKQLLDIVTSIGALCAMILFFVVVARVMVDVVNKIWSGTLW